VKGSCECGNVPSGFMKCEGFRDLLRNCQFIKKDSAPWSQFWPTVDLLPAHFVCCKVRHEGGPCNVCSKVRTV
jgi:hypothetical protein